MSNARRVPQPGEGPHDRVVDLDRAPAEGPPPVPGAQWDELHRRWERWDKVGQYWVVIGDAGDEVDPLEENPVSPLLARELRHADDLEAAATDRIIDVRRSATPGPAPAGAQWNEVAGRWERWDEVGERWVEAPVG